MSKQLSKLKDAIQHAHNLQEAKANIEALAPELGVKYDEYEVFGRH